MICKPCMKAADTGKSHKKCLGIVLHKSHCVCRHKRAAKGNKSKGGGE